jgi:acetolactate synthase I/II/III large subunit
LTRTAAQILVDQLLVHGVDTAFCVPGESYLQVLDALRDTPIRLVTTRHEAAAANMAEATGKLTGRPGICLVTRAPGATHASVGIHTAYQDSTPLILFVGQVPRTSLGREAFQELDYTRMFGEMAKWVATMEDAAGVPELVARAFHTATSGRPGPVVIALPEDVQGDEADVADAAPSVPSQASPSPDDVERARELLAASERPLLVVGGGGWSEQAGRDVIAFAEASQIPVVASWRRQSYVDNTSPAYAGPLTLGLDPKLAQRVRDADVILALGTRLGEIATGDYTLLEPPVPRQTLIHVHADPDELGRVYEPALGIVSGSPRFAAALTPVDGERRDWFEGAKADYLANLQHAAAPGELDMGEVVATLRRRLPADAILTNGAGNYSVWAHRFYEFRQYGTQLAPCAGAMGYGFPAALAAKLLRPDRTVVCLAGDGDFLMSSNDLATAIQYDIAVVVLVVNNGMLGTIRMHQERHFPNRPVATDLVNPDFAAYARSFGAHGAVVEHTADFEAAFDEALAAGRAAVLELRVDPEAITPRATLSQLRGG